MTPTSSPTLGIKLGTQPFGAILDPGTLQVGDVRWFREGSPGQLSTRKMRGAHRVKVTGIAAGGGTILVDYAE